MKTYIDEIALLKEEIKLLKGSRLSVNIDKDDTLHMKEDIITIKGELRKLNHRLMGEEVRRNSLLPQSLENNTVVSTGRNGNENETGDKNINLDQNTDGDGLTNGNELNDECGGSAECALGLQQGSVTSLAPTYAELASRPTCPENRFGEEHSHASHSFSPIAPPFSQMSTSVRGSGVHSGDGDHRSYSSAPPLSQVSVSAQVNCSLDAAEVDIDADKCTLVQSKKKRLKSAVVGSRTNTEGGGIRGARKYADLYIGNCDLDVSADSLILYITRETGINVHKCEPLESRSTVSKSFKISLNVNDRHKLLSPDVWPEDIVCRKFYNPRHQRS